MYKKIIFLIFMLTMLLTTSSIVYATTLTELNYEYGDPTSIIEENKINYPYYFYFRIKDQKFISFISSELTVVKENVTLQNVTSNFYFLSDTNTYNVKNYYLINGEWKQGYSKTQSGTSPYFYHDAGFPLELENIDYSSHDIKDNNGTVVFLMARYPLTSIKGQISSKTIRVKVLSGMKFLIPLVTGCLVLAIGFRKAWKMLRTVLLGA